MAPAREEGTHLSNVLTTYYEEMSYFSEFGDTPCFCVGDPDPSVVVQVRIKLLISKK
jgi:hypothetical protein